MVRAGALFARQHGPEPRGLLAEPDGLRGSVVGGMVLQECTQEHTPETSAPLTMKANPLPALPRREQHTFSTGRTPRIRPDGLKRDDAGVLGACSASSQQSTGARERNAREAEGEDACTRASRIPRTDADDTASRPASAAARTLETG